jgi:hypothetical protein
MTHEAALAILLSTASVWGENAEKGFVRRVKADDSNDTCREIAIASGGEDMYEDVITLRDLWQAVETLNGGQKVNQGDAP